jgi:hypothetical protein
MEQADLMLKKKLAGVKGATKGGKLKVSPAVPLDHLAHLIQSPSPLVAWTAETISLLLRAHRSMVCTITKNVRKS